MPSKPKQKSGAANPFEGRSFAATGQFEGSTQFEVKIGVEVRGGVFRDSVAKGLDFLVAGEKGGAKLAKAQKLGVQVLTIGAFRKMCDAVPITDAMTRKYLG